MVQIPELVFHIDAEGTHPVLVQKLELDLHVGPQLFKLSLLGVEAGLCVRLLQLVDLRLGGGVVIFKVTSVGVKLNPKE